MSSLERNIARGSLHPADIDIRRVQNHVTRHKIRETISSVMRRQFFANLIPYLLVLSLVVTLTILRDTTSQYHMDASAREIFIDEEFTIEDAHTRKNFLDVRSMTEFWQWFQGPLYSGLFPTEWYNGEPLGPEESTYLAHANKLIGTLRLRQLRVPQRTCSLRSFTDAFKNSVEEHRCYPAFTTKRVETDPFGPDDQWTFMEHTGSYDVRSTYSNVLYTSDGHVLDISLKDRNTARSIFAFLEKYRWVDLQTRAVFINFNVYNANTDVLGSVQLMVEFLESGDVGVDKSRIRFVPLFSFSRTDDIVIVILELILFVVLAFQAYTEWNEMWIAEVVLKGIPRSQRMSVLTTDGSSSASAGPNPNPSRLRRGTSSSTRDVARTNHLTADSAPPGCCGKRYLNLRYFTSVWNWVEMTNLLTFMITYYFKIQFYSDPLRRAIVRDAKFMNEERYLNVETMAENFYFHEWFWSVNILLTGLGFFKYVRLNKQLSLMWQVVALALTRILTLTLTLVVMLMSFSLAGYVVFGKTIHGFRNIQISVSTCCRLMFGEFDYEPLTEVNRYLTPLFFWVYVILGHLLLLNLFIAVLATAYDRIASGAETGDDANEVDYGMLPAFKRLFRYVTKCDWLHKKGNKRRKNRAAVIITDNSGSTLKMEDLVLAKLKEKHLLEFNGPIPAREIMRELSHYMIDVGSSSDEEDMDADIISVIESGGRNRASLNRASRTMSASSMSSQFGDASGGKTAKALASSLVRLENQMEDLKGRLAAAPSPTSASSPSSAHGGGAGAKASRATAAASDELSSSSSGRGSPPDTVPGGPLSSHSNEASSSSSAGATPAGLADQVHRVERDVRDLRRSVEHRMERLESLLTAALANQTRGSRDGDGSAVLPGRDVMPPPPPVPPSTDDQQTTLL